MDTSTMYGKWFLKHSRITLNLNLTFTDRNANIVASNHDGVLLYDRMTNNMTDSMTV